MNTNNNWFDKIIILILLLFNGAFINYKTLMQIIIGILLSIIVIRFTMCS